MSRAVALLAVAAVLIVANNVALRRLRPHHLAPQAARNAEAFRAIVEQWSRDGMLGAYRTWLWIDFATLAGYGIGGTLWTQGDAAVAALAPALRAVLPCLPTLAAVADAVENVLHLRLTSPRRAGMPDAAYALARVASLTKFALIGVFLALLAFAHVALRAGR